jgi:hypothetical protein
MNVSGILLVVLVVALFGLTIAYTVLGTTRPAITDVLSPKVGSMGELTRVGNSGDGRDKFLVPSGATVMAYIFTMINNKTPTIGNKQEAINLLSVGSAVKLQMLPGGVSAPPKTTLVVKTQNPDPAQPNTEEFPVADFPQQKWVHTAIVREGRRYTVYYNGKVVASHRTKFVPVIDSSTITLGDPKLIGEFVYPKVAPTPYRIDDIQNEINISATTRYEPIKPIDFSTYMASFAKIGCPNGPFCFSTQGQPTENPLKMWKTPYA